MARQKRAQIGERQRQRPIDQTADREPPAIAVDRRRARVRVDAVEVFDRRQLRACARHGHHR